ncbi:monovalent cation/H+ antiporter complex subunit F [Papillibacter cinnamivorans]|uniref:Multisubunit Na+/H+ antiporter, MnhF subunit n=1 Tax=Papillibacter cinnamivorans DSM 12816 TaxID=1122930 RepID=A0A1W2C5L3_9FIRM|nr:monovalent cation/H+ antiporter complex subunit F [Papillibacter cinnamivorans]SMC80162.1 Multisubunit Na+/H+ antiporter, MnhF subunit [Papillibacter cinnamivorans DSM 12816]
MTGGEVALFIAALFLIAAMLVMVQRIWKGPNAADRLNALFLIGTDTILLVCVLGELTEQLNQYVDIAITYALTGFIGLVIIGRYITGRSIDLQEDGKEPEYGETYLDGDDPYAEEKKPETGSDDAGPGNGEDLK